MADHKHNPLSSYFRQAKHYTPLPSGGRWYPPGSIEWPATNEVAVYPMTAKDEIAMKTPDALLNGQSTADVVQSCIPAIKNAWLMPSIDLDTILIAIRIASYGNLMDVTPNCPACQAVNNYQLDLKDALAQTLNREWRDFVEIDGLKIYIKPLNYKQINNKQYRTFEEQRILSEVQKSELSEDVKLKRFNEGFKKLTALTTEIVLDSIACIETPDGTQVTDPKLIEEFMSNTSSKTFTYINDSIKQNKDRFSLAPLQVKCQECEHEWQQALEFDAVSFFDLSSKD